MGKSRYKLPGLGRPEGGPGTDYVFILPRKYHYLSITQFNPFRPSPSRSATESQPFWN